MRILSILSGVCVLFTTLAYGHLLHHHLMHALHESSAGPLFWAGILAAASAWILSFIGGCLLLKRGR